MSQNLRADSQRSKGIAPRFGCLPTPGVPVTQR